MHRANPTPFEPINALQASTLHTIGLPTDSRNSPCATFNSHAEQWSSLLEHQVALLCATEFDWLLHSAAWLNSKSVVDVGCGNGDYLAALQRRFPAKSYVGTDTSEPLVGIAGRRHASSGLTFMSGDYCERLKDIAPDAAVLRFVVQHLKNPIDFFDRLAFHHPSLINVFVIEPDLQNSELIPEIPVLSRLISRHEERCEVRGHSRQSMSALNGLVGLIGEKWCVAEESQLSVTHKRESWSATNIDGALSGWLGSLSYLCTTEELASASRDLYQWTGQIGKELRLSAKIWCLNRTKLH